VTEPTPETPDLKNLPFAQTIAFVTALRLRVLAHLAQDPATADVLAERASISPRGTQALLDMLVAIGLVTVEGGVYRNTAFTNALVPSADALVEYFDALIPLWLDMAEHVRTGKARHAPESAEAVRFWRAMTPLYAGMMGACVASVVKELGLATGAPHVLDVGGGGAALWGAAVLAANPRARVTQFDAAAVNRDAEDRMRASGHADRFRTIDGDFRTADLTPGTFDVVVIANVLHHWDADTNRRLLRTVHAALRPGSRLVVAAAPPDDGRAGPAWALAISLAILPHSEAGRNYSRGEIARMMTDSGFSPPSSIDGGELTVLVASRS
jgi:SAM-dependent methyltransferase